MRPICCPICSGSPLRRTRRIQTSAEPFGPELTVTRLSSSKSEGLSRSLEANHPIGSDVGDPPVAGRRCAYGANPTPTTGGSAVGVRFIEPNLPQVQHPSANTFLSAGQFYQFSPPLSTTLWVAPEFGKFFQKTRNFPLTKREKHAKMSKKQKGRGYENSEGGWHYRRNGHRNGSLEL